MAALATSEFFGARAKQDRLLRRGGTFMHNPARGLTKRLAATLLRQHWRLMGGRSVRLFGENCRFVSETEFPIRPLVRLPRDDCLSNIVRYADLVQFHAACRCIAELSHPPVVIDVGAHHGTYAVVLGKMVQRLKGLLVAVEPNPQALKVLRRNVILNNVQDTVRVEPVAVMDRPGRLHFDIAGSQSRVRYSDLAGRSVGCVVEATTLTELLAKHGGSHVDLLMIDVEGAELPVLRGFPWDSTPVGEIFCELHPYAWRQFRYTGDDMRTFLSERGLRCFDMYLKEHSAFPDDAYIGPTRLVRAKLQVNE